MSASPSPTNEPPGSSRRFWLHLAVFVTLLAIWTWKLLEPRPVPEEVRRELSADLFLVVSKCAHAGVYAMLAALALTSPARAWRRPLVGLLLLHGIGTELAQHLMAVGRTGKVTDVLIDWSGIVAGGAVLRRWRGGERRTAG